jgi:probable HAF family extracellular repeat protein
VELKSRKHALRPLAAAASLGVASALVIAPSPVAALRPASYEVVDLGFGGEARAINSQGQVVGEGQLAGAAHFHPFLWTRGTITDLGVLEQGEREYGRATDINDHAQVVGFSVVRQDPEQSGQHAFLWQHGVLTDLDRSASDSAANAINNDGQIAGVRYTPAGPHAVSWQNGVMTDLGPGFATDINDQGQIIGSAAGTGATLWTTAGRTTSARPPGRTIGPPLPSTIAAG